MANAPKPGPAKPEEPKVVQPNETPRDLGRHVPDYLPEGTQRELDETGEATNPFTGERLTKRS